MSQFYLRKWSLVIQGDARQVDLSPLRIVFTVKQGDVQTPNYANIRVYNVSDETAQAVQKEGLTVRLQAGYEAGPYGVIFEGQLKQVRRGRENQTDTYLDILAGDGDIGINSAVLSQSLAAGSTAKDVLAAAQKQLEQYGVTAGYTGDLATTALPRGKVLYGMARDHLRALCASQGMTYSVQNGQLILLPLDGFKPGAAVVCNSSAGMIGLPEQTQNGIKVTMLINPALSVGSKLQINEGSIQQAAQPPQTVAGSTFAALTPGIAKNDGVYRIYVLEWRGDTRGQPWYAEIVCLATDPTVNMGVTPGLYQKGVAAPAPGTGG